MSHAMALIFGPILLYVGIPVVVVCVVFRFARRVSRKLDEIQRCVEGILQEMHEAKGAPRSAEREL